MRFKLFRRALRGSCCGEVGAISSSGSGVRGANIPWLTLHTAAAAANTVAAAADTVAVHVCMSFGVTRCRYEAQRPGRKRAAGRCSAT